MLGVAEESGLSQIRLSRFPINTRERAQSEPAAERTILIVPEADLSGKHARFESCAPGQCPETPRQLRQPNALDSRRQGR